MMFVVKTIEQLEEAIRANADEAVIIGRHAPEIMKTLGQRDSEKESGRIYPIFSMRNKNFEVLELLDNNHTVEGCLFRKSGPSY